MRAEVFSPADMDRVLCAHDELLGAARPYLQALSRAAGRERHAAMLGDARAVVLDLRADDETLRGSPGFPGPGALLSEAHAGANGIATPIAENSYVELAGPEHFISGFHPFTCQGIPLHGVDGETVGSLTVSVRTPRAAYRLHRILKVAARGIEAEMIVGRLRTRLRELPRDDDWAHLERLHQDVVQVHTAGRLEFELASFELARAADAEALIHAAREVMERFTRLSRLWQILVEPTTRVVEELDASQLVRDSSDLMQTEARMAGVTLRTATTPCGRVRRLHELVRALVHGHMVALRRAGEQGVVEVSTNERGCVEWTIVPAEGRPSSLHYDLQVVRP
jgi:transcriptional regulator of acetoin/glycerol metabolism